MHMSSILIQMLTLNKNKSPLTLEVLLMNSAIRFIDLRIKTRNQLLISISKNKISLLKILKIIRLWFRFLLNHKLISLHSNYTQHRLKLS